MKIFKTILFVLCSVLEVHVQAKGFLSLPVSTDVALEPADCVLKASVCSVTTGAREKYVLTFGTNEVTLGKNTVVIRESADTIHLVEGTIIVKSNKKTIVKCEYGKVMSQEGEYLMSREAGRVIVRAVSNPVTIIPLGSAEELNLEPGFQNWLYKVSSTGQAQSGVPLVWDFEGLVKNWARLYTGNKIDFRKKMQGFNDVWNRAVVSASLRHKLYAERMLASAEEDRKYKAELRKKDLE